MWKVSTSPHDEAKDWAIGIHGGAGDIKHVESIPERLDAFQAILRRGADLLAAGETAVDGILTDLAPSTLDAQA